MLVFLRGNLFESKAKALVNPVNCVGIMGRGLALEFKRRFPSMFSEYHEACRTGRLRPGNLLISVISENRIIICFPTKYHWQNPSRIEYIEKGLDTLRKYLISMPDLSIAIPPLGCGLGGLDWNEVKLLIVEKLKGLPNEILVYEK